MLQTGLLMPNHTAPTTWLSVRKLADRINVVASHVSDLMAEAETAGVEVIRDPEGRVLAVDADQFVSWWEKRLNRRRSKPQALGEIEDLHPKGDRQP